MLLHTQDPDEESIKEFLVERLGFNPERVAAGLKRLKDARLKTTQRRVDSFFKILPSTTSTIPPGGGYKRKATDAKKGASGPASKKKPVVASTKK